MYIHINICNCQGLIHSLKLDILWISSVLQKTLVLGEIVEYNITNRHSRIGLGLNVSTGKPSLNRTLLKPESLLYQTEPVVLNIHVFAI